MTPSRGAIFILSSSLLATWFVTLAVRMSVGAPGADAPPAFGALPAPRQALAPLRIPDRDPFAADIAAPGSVVTRTGEPALASVALTTGGARHPEVDVPDVAAVGSTASGVGIMATIVSNRDAYALVDERGTSRIARVRDALGGSTIATISNDAVTLANGVRIPLQEAGAGVVPASPANIGMPASSPATWRGSTASRSEFQSLGPIGPANVGPAAAEDRPASADVAPSVHSTTDISAFGHTVLTSPNGAAVPQGPAGVAIPNPGPGRVAPAPWAPGPAVAPVFPGTGSLP